MGRVLPDVLRELGLGEAATAARISQTWAELVGPDAAAHSWPAALRGGTLDVEVDASAWAQHLQLRRPELLQAFAQRLGAEAPRALRLRIGRSSGSVPPSGRGAGGR